MEIRHLQQNDDRMAISRIYERSWKYAYSGIIPQDYLYSIPEGKWAAHLDDAGRASLVAADNGVLVGTASFFKSRFAEFAHWGEIVSIYLLPEYIGKGYGAALLDAAVRELVEMCYHNIFLWVLEENSLARAFYEKHGFEYSGHFLTDNIGGKSLRELQYCRAYIPPRL